MKPANPQGAAGGQETAMRTYDLAIRPDDRSRELAERLNGELTARGWARRADRPEILIVLGGDGTFIRSVHQHLEHLADTAVCGLHSGTLGFLLDYPSDELDALVADLCENRLREVSLPLLEAVTEQWSVSALNEIRIENPLRTQQLTLRMNGEWFEDFRGTGVCICTQTGSTALNRSLGGAVVQSGLAALQLTEIAGIHHSAYRSLGAPFVFAEDTEVTLEAGDFSGALLGADDAVKPLDGLKRVLVRKDPARRIRLLRRPGASDYQRLTRLL